MANIEWTPNRENRLPVYRQIVEYIKNRITSGHWPAGTKLPPQRDLARQLGVNRSTLTNALDELVADGLLESRIGSGVRVSANPWAQWTAAPRVDWNSYMESGAALANFPTVQEINRGEFIPDMIRLGTGELSPELIPVTLLKKILSRLPEQITSFGYEEPLGLLALRRLVSEYLATLGIQAGPESILIVSGGLQALHLIFSGLLPSGSTVLLENPSYLFSLKQFQSLPLQFCGLPLDHEGIDLTLLQQSNRPNAALLYTIPCFHNPTGTLMTRQRREDLLSFCRRRRLPLIEDDVYRELWLDAPPPPPLKALEQGSQVLYIDSLSKALSPGLRIGWIVGPETVIQRLADLKMQCDYGSSTLSQWAAAECLSDGHYNTHLTVLRQQLQYRRQVMLEALTEHCSGLAEWQVPSGGFYVWLRLVAPLSLSRLFRSAWQQKLLLNPGNLYDPFSRQHLRLSYAYAAIPDLKKGVARLAQLIRESCTASGQK